MIDLSGRVVIVTGAGGGLGREHALLLAARNTAGDGAYPRYTDAAVRQSVTKQSHAAADATDAALERIDGERRKLPTGREAVGRALGYGLHLRVLGRRGQVERAHAECQRHDLEHVEARGAHQVGELIRRRECRD